MPITPKLLYIEWDDHWRYSTSSWVDEDRLVRTVKAGGCKCITVGFLLHEDSKHLTLVATLDGEGSVSGDQTILKNCITKRRVLNRKP